jgi:hypothetical protein
VMRVFNVFDPVGVATQGSYSILKVSISGPGLNPIH